MAAHNAARTTIVEQRRVTVAGTTLSYEVTGAGRAVVLVHGLSGSRRWWAHNIPVLARQFRVYSIDLAGFGGSRRGGRFVLREAAQLLLAWMDSVALERASLVGHSMGGQIVAELAADAPARVERLVLVDAAALPFGAGYTRALLGLLRAVRYLRPTFVPVLTHDALRAGPLTLSRAALALLRSDIEAKLAQITAPTLLVWGEHDTLVPLQIGHKLVGSLPKARLVVINGAGHNPMWDRPDAFNNAVAAFLAIDSAAGAW